MSKKVQKIAELVMARKDGIEEHIPLLKVPFVLGRSEGDKVLDDPAVSRRHASIEARGKDWFLKDLGSSNGTFVNGDKVEAELKLKEGDKIRIGRAEMVFRTGAAPAVGPERTGVAEETSLWTLVELGVGSSDRNACRCLSKPAAPGVIPTLVTRRFGSPTTRSVGAGRRRRIVAARSARLVSGIL